MGTSHLPVHHDCCDLNFPRGPMNFPGWVFLFEMSGSPRHSTSQQLPENQSPRTPGKLEPSQSSLKCIEEIFLLILGKEPIPHTWLMSVHPRKIPIEKSNASNASETSFNCNKHSFTMNIRFDGSKPGKNQLVSHFLQTSTHLSIKLLNSFHTKQQKKKLYPSPPQKKTGRKSPRPKPVLFFVFVVNGAHLDALCRSSFWKLSHAASKGHPGGYFFPVKNGVEKNQHLQSFQCHWKNPRQKYTQKMEKSQLNDFNFYHCLICMDWCLNCYMKRQVSIPNLKLSKATWKTNCRKQRSYRLDKFQQKMMSFRVPMWVKQWRRRGWSLFYTFFIFHMDPYAPAVWYLSILKTYMHQQNCFKSRCKSIEIGIWVT